MKYVAVVGAAECSSEVYELAREVGREIARSGAILLCGGRGGVMEAACRGATETGGVAIGILPGFDRSSQNPYVTYSIVTGLGDARNAVLVRSADAVIAISGGYGTLSEIGLALKAGRRVVGLHTWEIRKDDGDTNHLIGASSPKEAVKLAVE